jgi:hypothetical protein
MTWWPWAAFHIAPYMYIKNSYPKTKQSSMMNRDIKPNLTIQMLQIISQKRVTKVYFIGLTENTFDGFLAL